MSVIIDEGNKKKPKYYCPSTCPSDCSSDGYGSESESSKSCTRKKDKLSNCMEILITKCPKKKPSLSSSITYPQIIRPSKKSRKKSGRKKDPCPVCPCGTPRICILNRKVFDENLKKLSITQNVVKDKIKKKKKKRKKNKRSQACKIENAKQFFMSWVSEANRDVFKDILDAIVAAPRPTPKVCSSFRKNPRELHINLCPYTCAKFNGVPLGKHECLADMMF